MDVVQSLQYCLSSIVVPIHILISQRACIATTGLFREHISVVRLLFPPFQKYITKMKRQSDSRRSKEPIKGRRKVSATTSADNPLQLTTSSDNPQELIHEFSDSPQKLFHQLTLHDTDVSIKARLLHAWRSYSPSNPELIFDYGTLWVDETGMLIHGIGNRNFVADFESKLSIGFVYKIQKFIVQQAKQMYRPCKNGLSIFITPSTKFEDVTASSLDFCPQSFEFCNFETLGLRTGSKELLTDVVGCLKSISPVEYTDTCNGAATKQSLILQDERGTTLSISLWGDLAYKLKAYDLALPAQASPVIIAIGGLLITSRRDGIGATSISATRIILNPQSLDFGDFKPYPDDFEGLIKVASDAAFSVSLIPVTNDTPEKKAEHALQSQRILKQLIELRATCGSPNMSYICQATITAIKSPTTWAYRGCTKCSRKVTECGSNYWCLKDNQIAPSETKPWYLTRLIVQDGSDEAVFLLIGETADRIFTRKCSKLYDNFPQGTGILPPDIQSLCGQTLEFHVKLPNQNYKGGDGDFIISKIIGLLQRNAKTDTKKLLTSASQNRNMDNASEYMYSNPTTKLPTPLLKGTEISKEETNSSKTDAVLKTKKKMNNKNRASSPTHLDGEVCMISTPPSTNENSLTDARAKARSCRQSRSSKINVPESTNKKRNIGGSSARVSKRKASTAAEFVTQADNETPRPTADAELPHPQSAVEEIINQAKHPRGNHTNHNNEDKVLMIDQTCSDNKTTSSDDEQPLSKMMATRKGLNKKQSPAGKVLSEDHNDSINSPLAKVKKEKLSAASKLTPTPATTTAAEKLRKRKRQPVRKYAS
ncbi:unnamed protein product [Linum trigynum]|uniref:Replication factor A C-terminal domain-containing protein n=1 Tax=Linum trigynum TaxID=586398 RepID=A0AAV2CSN2_9ROSI